MKSKPHFSFFKEELNMYLNTISVFFLFVPSSFFFSFFSYSLYLFRLLLNISIFYQNYGK